MFPHYSEIKPDVHVRVTSLPVCDSLRDLRENQLGTSLSSFAFNCSILCHLFVVDGVVWFRHVGESVGRHHAAHVGVPAAALRQV